jgi:hypothetical protein
VVKDRTFCWLPVTFGFYESTIDHRSKAGIGNIAYLCGKRASAFLADR